MMKYMFNVCMLWVGGINALTEEIEHMCPDCLFHHMSIKQQDHLKGPTPDHRSAGGFILASMASSNAT